MRMGEVSTYDSRGIMVESSSPNFARRHQFTSSQEDEAEPSKPPAGTEASPGPPLTSAITGVDQAREGVTNPNISSLRHHHHHLRTPLVNASVSTMNTEDARDEEDDSFDAATRSSLGDDPFVYSDDSASLSDAYFFPQFDEEYHARPPRYRNEEDVEASRAALLQYPLGSYYGSVSPASALQERSNSPLWVAGSIREDSEMPNIFGNPEIFPLLLASNNDPRTKGRNNERRRQRRHKTHNSKRGNAAALKQQKSVNRERAVAAIRGRPQDTSLAHDVIWAVLFLLQLLAVIVCAIRFGYKLLSAGTDSHHLFLRHDVPWINFTTHDIRYSHDIVVHSEQPLMTPAAAVASSSPSEGFSFTIDYQNVIALVSITGFYSCVVTYLSFGFMLVLARALIQIMMVFSVLLASAWILIGLTLDPYGVISMMGFAALLLTLGYTMYNWSSIPFAATNLYTAFCAMRCTADIAILALVCLLFAFAWCVVWGMALIGIVNSLNSVECDYKDACGPHVSNRHIPLYLLLLFSFHWTNTVIKNITRVTVASVVGTWWFYPGDIGPFCTPAVVRPLLRSLTKSLGSICLGSLVVQPAQALVAIINCWCCILGNPESNCTSQKQHDSPDPLTRNGNILVSHVDEEVESAVDSIGLFRRLFGLKDRLSVCLRSCNRWSYTYIGMYGYGFAEAGERAIQLFETREWLDVVKDVLIQNVLLMASLIIGGSTGTIAVVVEETGGYEFTSFHTPMISAFIVGSVLGYVLSNILLLGVIGSAVNTVLVCFAAGPFEFDRNHPRLSREMRDVWSQQVWEPSI